MNYKGMLASKLAKHKYLYKHYGRPTYCTNTKCTGKSKIFEWCLKRGRRYSHNSDDYLWLCRSCHRKYDMTEKKKRLALKNLWWKRGIDNPGTPHPENMVPHPKNLWWYKDKVKMKDYEQQHGKLGR